MAAMSSRSTPTLLLATAMSSSPFSLRIVSRTVPLKGVCLNALASSVFKMVLSPSRSVDQTRCGSMSKAQAMLLWAA